MARYTIKIEEVGDWIADYTRIYGLMYFQIHHKPGCATETNTVADLLRIAPKLGQPDALEGLPTCDCVEVEIEIRG